MKRRTNRQEHFARIPARTKDIEHFKRIVIEGVHCIMEMRVNHEGRMGFTIYQEHRATYPESFNAEMRRALEHIMKEIANELGGAGDMFISVTG